jgi:hypothetical protein
MVANSTRDQNYELRGLKNFVFIRKLLNFALRIRKTIFRNG